MRNVFVFGAVWAAFAIVLAGCTRILGDFTLNDRASVLDGGVSESGEPDGTAPDVGAPEEGGRSSDAVADGARDAPATGAQLTVDQTSVDFGTATVGRTVAPSTLTITNGGSADTRALTVAVASAGFTTSMDGCSGTVLHPNGVCHVTIGVDTTSAAMLAATFTVTDTANDKVTVALKADVITAGAISITPDTHDFGSVVTQGSSSPFTFQVTNTGMTPTGTLAASFSGSAKAEFSMVDGCSGKTLAPNAACNVVVTMSPATVGSKTASLAVTGTPGGTGTASLSGTGVSPANITISPTSWAFPTTATGSTATEAFQITNTGGVTSTALTTALTLSNGTASGEFAISSDTCNATTLAAGATCTVTVQFAPATRGSKGGSLDINGGTPHATLTGTGQDSVTLTVTRSGSGGGTVSGDQINCPGTCSEQVARTTTDPIITLTATPDGTSTFAGWSGACTGAGTCAVTMSQAQTVNAIFNKQQVTLTVTFRALGAQTGSLTSSPAGISLGSPVSGGSASFDIGSTVVLTVTGISSAAINAWSNACTGRTCSLTMNASQTVSFTSTLNNIVFVSSQGHTGNFGGVAGGDAFCNTLARQSSVPGTFVAYLGTSTASPTSHLGSARGWIRLDGLPFADTVTNIQNSVLWYPAAVNDLGQTLDVSVFTGAVQQLSNTCGDWTSTTGISSGAFSCADEGAIYWQELAGLSCASANSVYCFGTDFSTAVAVNPAAGRHAFSTSGTFNPSSGIANADSLCQNEASTAGLANSGNFKALLATTTSSAASRFNLNGAQWVRPDGVVVATTPSNLMNSIFMAPIAVHADKSLADVTVWVGSSAGLLSPSGSNESCSDWSSASSSVSGWFGEAATGDSLTFKWNNTTCNNTTYAGLVCLEN
jgi:hypothetical protein